MNLTDEQLMLLEQITYLNDDVFDAAGLSLRKYDYENAKSVDDLIDAFNETALNELEKMGDEEVKSDKIDLETGEPEGTHVSGKEWAQLIRAIQNDDDIKKLQVSRITTVASSDKDGYNFDAMTFSEKGNEKDAVVCFRGTLNKKEWVDDAEYISGAATDCNQAAMVYINGLPYSNITVVGHSKGANKAAYVYFGSDKVTRCLALDMPGFPPEFYLQYEAEIAAKLDGIKCYALESDFVNILVLPIPGLNPPVHYYKGNGVANFAENHCPNCFFFYDENGNPQIIEGDQTESMKILHNLTAFIALEMHYEERIKIAPYIGNILGMAMGGEDHTQKEKVDTILADVDALTTIVAYFKKYCEVYDVDTKDILNIALDIMFNNEKEKEAAVKELLKEFAVATGGTVGAAYVTNPLGTMVAMLLLALFGAGLGYNQYKDLIKLVMAKLEGTSIAEDINAKYNSLDTLQKRDTLDYDEYSGTSYDYSKEAYEVIKNSFSDFNNVEYNLPSTVWNNYTEEEWYTEISCEEIKTAITDFIGMVPTLNDNCLTELKKSFKNEWKVDKDYSKKFDSYILFFDSCIGNVRSLKERLEANISIDFN